MLSEQIAAFLAGAGIAMPLFNLLAYLFIVFVGATVHWAKLRHRKQVPGLAAYLTTNVGASSLSLLGVFVAWWFLVESNETSILTYFWAGYFCDSALNKYMPAQAEHVHEPPHESNDAGVFPPRNT